MATTDWQIRFRGIVSQAAIIGGTVMGFHLRTRAASTATPCFFVAPVLAGLGLTQQFCGGSWRSFTTSTALDPGDLDGWGSASVAASAVIAGAAIVNVNLWRINHSPNPIICDSPKTFGIGVGVGWMPGHFIVRTDVVIPLTGSAQVPTDGSVKVLDDSDDRLYEMAGLLADYLQNTTSPDYMT